MASERAPQRETDGATAGSLGEWVFFGATDGVHGRELWRTDGTPAGTVQVRNISRHASSFPRSFIASAGRLFFTARDGSPRRPAHGRELWVTDGTRAGTQQVKDIAPNVGSFEWFRGSHPNALTDLNGTLFFVADDAVHGRELWRSDGTEAGTRMVKDISTGSDWGLDDDARLVRLDDVLLFAAFDAPHGRELWKSDGTATGTTLVHDINPGRGWSGPYDFSRLQDAVFFFTTYEAAFRKSDGTEAGTTLVKDPLLPWYYRGTALASVLIFSADDLTHGNELWQTDGTEAGTTLLHDIRDGSNSSSPSKLVKIGAALYFAANDGTHGNELWRSDGTEAGTVLVRNMRPGRLSSHPSTLRRFGGTLYFAANDGTHGYELWRSDGTEAGTVLVRDVMRGSQGSRPWLLRKAAGGFLFAATDRRHGRELWWSDGTRAGTRLVKDIKPGERGSNPG